MIEFTGGSDWKDAPQKTPNCHGLPKIRQRKKKKNRGCHSLRYILKTGANKNETTNQILLLLFVKHISLCQVQMQEDLRILILQTFGLKQKLLLNFYPSPSKIYNFENVPKKFF